MGIVSKYLSKLLLSFQAKFGILSQNKWHQMFLINKKVVDGEMDSQKI